MLPLEAGRMGTGGSREGSASRSDRPAPRAGARRRRLGLSG